MKKRILSDDVTREISFLNNQDLNILLHEIDRDNYQVSSKLDFFSKTKYISHNFEDRHIIPFLPAIPELIAKDKVTRDKELEFLKEIQKIDKTISKISTGRRGRRKSESTLKDKVFLLLKENINISYDDVLKSGIVNIKDNTFKVILSQYRKENNIKVKRGRKKKGFNYFMMSEVKSLSVE